MDKYFAEDFTEARIKFLEAAVNANAVAVPEVLMVKVS